MELFFISLIICVPVTFSVRTEDVIGCHSPTSDYQCCQLMRTDTLPNLDIAYNCSHPDNVTIIPPPGTNQTTTFRLFHSYLCVTSLPQDICDYPNIVSIRFDSNALTSIPSLSCLKNLIALDLSYNRIETLKNATFLGLSRLRYINLRSNRISSIEPHTFKEDLHGLMIVLLDYNLLTTAEAWPLRIKHTFCHFGLSYNRIKGLSNEENWFINISDNYGPGMVDLSYNQFTVWITVELHIYGFNDLMTLGHLFRWGFDLRGNPWVCDCKVHKFLKLISNLITFAWRYYYAVLCQSPPSLKGKQILDVPLSSFVCNITEKCPSGCFCQDQPENKRMFVDCRNGHLTSLPLDLPDGNLHLLLTNNSITSLERRYYLDRTQYIDVSCNHIVTVAVEAIHNLQYMAEYVNLSHNHLTHLPRTIQNIPLSKLDLRHNMFNCDCNSKWMSDWFKRYSKDHLNSHIQCKISDKSNVEVIRADDIYRDCQDDPTPTLSSVILGVLVVIFILFVIILVVFRYEVMVLIHLTLTKKLTEGRVCDYDIFVSVDEECDRDRMWVSLTVLQELEQNYGLKVYYPPRDMDPGSVTVQELIDTLKKSYTALIVVSDSYVTSPTMMSQFMEAYNILVKLHKGRIILVRATEVEKTSNRYFNAFLRLKQYIDKDDEKLFVKIVGKVKKELSIKMTRNSS